MKKALLLLTISSLIFVSCSSDDDNTEDPMNNNVTAPATYNFLRNGSSTVSFGGQTTRILMAEELTDAMKDFDNATEESMQKQFAHQQGEDNFSDSDLNSSDKNIRSKTAASRDFFSTNTAESELIRTTLADFISTQVAEVFPNIDVVAAPGVAGQIADGSSTRYVTGQGVEMDQLLTKSLIGALMADQMLNNYLSTAILDEGQNRTENDNEVTAQGKTYTTMEHKWDEAYGYLYGTAQNPANPVSTTGDDDSFLNKYVGRVEGDPDFAGIAQEIFDAFKLGRAAIVAKNYEVRDEQAAIIREKISEIIGIRAVYYLQQARIALEQDNFGTAFHDLSEGWGFIYSLRFTHNSQGNVSYFSRSEVDGFLEDLFNDGPNGLWDLQPATLDAISDAIAAKFSFTVEQAGSTN